MLFLMLLLLFSFFILQCSIKLGSFASAYVGRCWRRCCRRRRQALPKAPSLAVRSGCVKWAVRVCVCSAYCRMHVCVDRTAHWLLSVAWLQPRRRIDAVSVVSRKSVCVCDIMYLPEWCT